MRTVNRDVRRDASLRRTFVAGFGAGVRTRKSVGRRAGDRRHADQAGHERPRGFALRVPGNEWIDRHGLAIQIPAKPTRARRVGHARGAPDVEAGEVRAALVGVAGALNHRQPARVKDRLEAGEPRVQAQRDARRVGADLQHVGGRNRNRRPPHGVVRIEVRNDRAQRVVAAAEIHHHEVARGRALRERDIANRLRRRKAERERGDAALDELSS